MTAPVPPRPSRDPPCSATFVMPRTPMLGLEEVEPLPVPSSPAMMQEMPSVKMPLGNEENGPMPTVLSCSIPARSPGLPRGGQGTEVGAVPVNGVHGGSRGSRQPGAGVVVPDGLDDARQRGAEHAQHGRRGHRRQTPLACPRGRAGGQGGGHPTARTPGAPLGLSRVLPGPGNAAATPRIPQGAGWGGLPGTHRGRGPETRVPRTGSPPGRPSWPCSRTPRAGWGRRRCASARSRAATPP